MFNSQGIYRTIFGVNFCSFFFKKAVFWHRSLGHIYHKPRRIKVCGSNLSLVNRNDAGFKGLRGEGSRGVGGVWRQTVCILCKMNSGEVWQYTHAHFLSSGNPWLYPHYKVFITDIPFCDSVHMCLKQLCQCM